MSVRALIRNVTTSVGYRLCPEVGNVSASRFVVLGGDAHFFVGYHDHDPLSPDGKSILCHRVEHKFTKTVEPEYGEVGLMNIATGEFNALARVHALNWQLGSRAQWLDGTSILFNDVNDNLQCCSVVDVRSGKRINRIPWPFWSISPCKRLAVSLNFSVLKKRRPGYGYRGTSPDGDSNILRVFDLKSHRVVQERDLSELVSQLEIDCPEGKGGYLNHICWSHNSTKFVTILCWECEVSKRRFTYGILVDLQNHIVKALNTSGFFSHMAWLNDKKLLAYVEANGRRAYQIWCETDGWSEVNAFPREDGHPTIGVNGNEVFVDTYPDRFSRIDLFRCSLEPDAAPQKLATVTHNPQCTGPLRCDLHPRFSLVHSKLVCDISNYGSRKLMVLDV